MSVKIDNGLEGEEIKSQKGGGYMALYFLRSINKEDFGKGIFGYTDFFDGLGIFINTPKTRVVDGGERIMNRVYAGFSNGTVAVNPLRGKNKTFKRCGIQLRGKEGSKSTILRLENDGRSLHLSFYNEESDSFETCLVLEEKIDYDGYLVLTGNSGF
jgi:hypothetical protein